MLLFTTDMSGYSAIAHLRCQFFMEYLRYSMSDFYVSAADKSTDIVCQS
jgi:hypothetical protein